MKHTNIPWADATWNPWHGCQKVSPGCKYCYMYRDKELRYGQDPTIVKRSKKNTFVAPQKWQDPKLIFTCSWSDFFIEEADEWRMDAWDVIRNTPQHFYLILTKRPERIFKGGIPSDFCMKNFPNVMFGVSIESQDQLHRLNEIMYYSNPFFRRPIFLSLEPLLGSIKLLDWQYLRWVIVGGESGFKAPSKYRYRECELGWIYEIIHACQFHRVPVFVKQLGTHLADKLELLDTHGRDLDEWELSLQIREFPDIITKHFANQKQKIS